MNEQRLPQQATEVIGEWVRRLRSGEYQQCKGTLHRFDPGELSSTKELGYCCLGVLSEQLAEQGLVPLEWRLGEGTGPSGKVAVWYGLRAQRVSNEIPQAVYEACDLGFFSKGTEDELIEMNDCLDKSFEEIADFLEEKFLQPCDLPEGGAA